MDNVYYFNILYILYITVTF